MAERWTLNRAGIVNVYQYGEEVLRFGGGRLLLRGVNGSGKSTAMNMLLPFLLDADVRRIDASGDQTGVLRSWMLSGRDEPQPTGYLWLEMARGDDHLVFGCGIKASRSSDTVNHWWFITERRPGIDLDLVRSRGQGRVPLSAEELRAEIGPQNVWAKDQRPSYRAALGDRLFGGADLDQHLRLLRTVRNPRVGDKVAVDLPQHLHDALPQLSEAAIDDAATPLEQLDEHRRNVNHLSATVATLDVLVVAYQAHVRTEVHRHLDTADQVLRRHRRATSAAAAAEREHEVATTEASRLERTVGELDEAVATLTAEIEQLQASPAYVALVDLEDRRARLEELADEVRRLRQVAVEQRARADAAAVATTTEQKATDEAVRRVDDDVEELRASLAAARIELSVPVRPAIATTMRTVAGDTVAVPAGPFDEDPRPGLAPVRQAAQAREAQVAEAESAVGRVERAEETLRDADAHQARAAAQATKAAETVGVAAGARRDAGRAWAAAATDWCVELREHAARAAIEPPLLPDLSDADVTGDHVAIHRRLGDAVAAVGRQHDAADATLEVRESAASTDVDDARRIVDELAGRTLPDPPQVSWQGERAAPCLAEVVDFVHDVSDRDRSGLEAALEASGLLGAEVRADATLAVGDLVVVPGPGVPASLGLVLRVDLGDAPAPGVTAEVVDRILAGISTDPSHLAAGDGPPVVTVDGAFAVGPLRGRHAKGAAEHIGVAARRARLERQRRDAAAALAAAEAALDLVRRHRAALAELREQADALAARLPATTELVRAEVELAAATERQQTADDERSAADDARRLADDVHARTVTDTRRTCAALQLPPERTQLAVIDRACRSVAPAVTTVERSLVELGRAVRRWADTGGRWADERRAAAEAADHGDQRQAALSRGRSELATAEDGIGLDDRDLLATVEHAKGERGRKHRALADARRLVAPAQQRVGDARRAAETARSDLDGLAGECAREVARLGAVLDVPGLREALAEATDEDEGAVSGTGPAPDEASPAGLARFVRATRAWVARPAEETSAESVRQTIRQRRATLGAGWDAVDRQADPGLPLAVEVNGPLGQMPLAVAARTAAGELASAQGLLTAQQDEALRNLLQGLIAKEVADKLAAAEDLVRDMNVRLGTIRTTHGIGVSLRWRRADDLGPDLDAMVDLLARPADLRTADDDATLVAALSARLDDAKRATPDIGYRELIAGVLDYRTWHQMRVIVHRPGMADARLSSSTPLSEGEKKIVSYQPLFAAVAASCDGLARHASDAPRFVLLDDAFAKVSEDNHPKLFGLLVDLDLDFIATSERLRGTHATVPELAITEVVRDADAGVIVLEHAHWDGVTGVEG